MALHRRPPCARRRRARRNDGEGELRDDVPGWDGLKEHIEKRLHSDLGLKLEVDLVPEDALLEWSNRGREGKPRRILDHRFEKK